MDETTFARWFDRLSDGKHEPHPWQRQLGLDPECTDRLIRVPTGLGKTLGVLGAWALHRVHLGNDAWPRRLVWCLPMRVLVEQTQAEAERVLRGLEVLWDGKGNHAGKVGVHLLMGGSDAGEWHLWPEECAVLIGTQDMLLSRALNRGYAAPRARWPMDFGLLNQDCLWIMDEVQLMDVGLATSAQLQAFREQDRDASFRPCVTWWMSATLQRDWLSSVDTADMIERAPQNAVKPDERRGPLWAVEKPLRVEPGTEDPAGVAALALSSHARSKPGQHGRVTLAVLNTVARAVAVHAWLKNHKPSGTDLRLVHSRFRPHERQNWREEFLCKEACTRDVDRIVVATQVVEAGVDVSANVLVTDLAPWPSLVQRFGRAARWGGSAQVVVVDRQAKDDKDAGPYTKRELDAAREIALAKLDDVAQARIEDFESGLAAEERTALYPYSPQHLLLRHEWDELFDTTADLTGADLEISRFIRSGDERDLHVFWHALALVGKPDAALRPVRNALCPVRFLDARDWLCDRETKGQRKTRLKDGIRAWVWDWLDGRWRSAERRDLYPGQTVLVAAECGGYSPEYGWDPDAPGPVSTVAMATPQSPDTTADEGQDDESLSVHPWKTIAAHGKEVGALARTLAERLAPQHTQILDLAGRWHDLGKAHPCLQGSIRREDRPARQDLAKAPNDAWLPRRDLYQSADGRDQRRGLRHELASTLALFSILQRSSPDHEALLGPWRELLEKLGRAPGRASPATALYALGSEIVSLHAHDFDLLAYLTCCHHGKVRMTWHACPADQEYRDKDGRGQPIRGVRQADTLPAVMLYSANGEPEPLGELVLDLAPSAVGLSARTGRSWTERTLALRHRHGPAGLAWLEALMRAADIRASRRDTPDPLLREARR